MITDTDDLFVGIIIMLNITLRFECFGCKDRAATGDEF